jgi:class 3 adenylate cyclase
MGELPSGTVTFLFTDIEGSTRLLHAVGRQHYRDVLVAHHALVREAIERNAGVVVDTQGDAFFAAFPRAIFAVRAAIEAQRALAGHDWPAEAPVRVRIGLHTGDAEVEDEHYVGLAVHRAQRITSAAHGGQTLLSATTRRAVDLSLSTTSLLPPAPAAGPNIASAPASASASTTTLFIAPPPM